jgi:ATP-binding cassette subfamily B protein RaxB
MVAAHHGQRFTLSELRRKVAISLKGTTLKSLMAIADTLGFSTRPLRLDLDALSQLKTPAILH